MEQSDFLAYRDKEGRYCDFHSLRHGYCTMLGKLRLSAKEHQDLARHSTYALTARYTHSRFYDLSAAVQGLPIPTGKPDSESLAATGTDNLRGKTNQKSLGPFLGPYEAISGNSERQTETVDTGLSPTKNPGKHAVFQGFSGCDSGLSKVEAPGIEPGSRCTSVLASTCVAGQVCKAEILRPRLPRSPTVSPTGRVPGRLTDGRFCNRRLRCGCPVKGNLWRLRARFSNQARTSRAKLLDPGLPFIRQPRNTAVQQLLVRSDFYVAI